MDLGLFLPQAALSGEDVERRALAAESAGFRSLWLFDHLFPPMQPEVPSLEGWTLATHLLARTTTLRVGHLVLCASLRHPALLAKMATTADVLSGGRVEIGLGSGSAADEHRRAGIPWDDGPTRTVHLHETLAVVTAMFTGAPTTFAGQSVTVTDMPNLPAPVQQPRPPVHVGGTGPGAMAAAARYADVWNLPTYGLGRADELHAAMDRACIDAGREPATLRRSHQCLLVVGRDTAAVDEAMAVANRRYGASGWGLAHALVGTPPQVADQLLRTAERGVELVIVLPHDRGAPATLDLIGTDVLPRLA